MLVNWRGVTIVLAVLAAVVVLSVIDLRCTAPREPDVLARVKGELQSGRREGMVIRRDQLAEQLRDLRQLNQRLVDQGETKRARELTRLIVEIERQYERLDRELEKGKKGR